MITHKIENQFQKNCAIRDIGELDTNKTWLLTIRTFKENRSLEQNSLSHVWYAQLAATLREYSAKGYKAMCKLQFGVPILRTEDENFRALYDRVVKPHDYETKLQVMDYFPVTSLMNTVQMSEYMEAVQRAFADRCNLQFPGGW